MQVALDEAKGQLSELLALAAQGEAVIIATPERAVKLVPIEKPKKKRRQMGALEGKIWMSDDFDAPLDEMREHME